MAIKDKEALFKVAYNVTDNSTLINFLNNWVPYVTHSFFIHLVLQMIIGYSTFLMNIYLHILVKQLSNFVNAKALLTN